MYSGLGGLEYVQKFSTKHLKLLEFAIYFKSHQPEADLSQASRRIRQSSNVIFSLTARLKKGADALIRPSKNEENTVSI